MIRKCMAWLRPHELDSSYCSLVNTIFLSLTLTLVRLFSLRPLPREHIQRSTYSSRDMWSSDMYVSAPWQPPKRFPSYKAHLLDSHIIRHVITSWLLLFIIAETLDITFFAVAITDIFQTIGLTAMKCCNSWLNPTDFGDLVVFLPPQGHESFHISWGIS